MSKILNIIIIGEYQKEVEKTLSSINDISNQKNISIMIITPKKLNLDFKFLNCKNIVLTNDNGEGIYQAMNIGINSKEKKGNFYNWFLNSGDYAVSHLLKEKVSFLDVTDENNEIIFYINNKKLSVVNSFFHFLKIININDANIIKTLFILLIFPSSHQNILIRNKIHNKFDTKYKYSSDFDLIAKLLFINNSTVTIKLGSIAKTSYGGITDKKRLKTLLERYYSIKNTLKKSDYKFLIFFINISIIIRLFFLIPYKIKKLKLKKT